MKRFTALALMTIWLAALAGTPAYCQSQEPSGGGDSAAPSQAGSQDQKPKSIKEWVTANRSRKGAVTGAIVGGVLGGLRAKLLGQNVARGVAAGAAVGGVAGYLIGRHKDVVQYSRDEAVRAVNYQPGDGYVIRVQEIRFDPQTVQPGQKATLHIRYLVIGPDPKETLEIHCYRGIKYQGSYLTGEDATIKVPHGGGIVDATAEFELPSNAPNGTYSAEAQLEDTQGRANQSQSSPLYIAS